MRIVACYKIVPEEQDLVVKPDRSFDASRAELKLGDYDLNAIEAAVQLAEATGGEVSLLTAGASQIDNSKLIKAALSRGAKDLKMVIDDAIAGYDAYQTAALLGAAASRSGFDLIVCGEGSADNYAQQVGCQLGEQLGLPCVNSVSKLEPVEGRPGTIRIERTLEREIEVLELDLPAVVSVTTDINLPRIPQLKDILAAGKKDNERCTPADLGVSVSAGIEQVSTLAPESVERKHVIYEGLGEGLESFAQAVKQEL